uniref:Kinetochore-associated protein 1 n=1 Tax=Diabrotica virgifera virgifera TaxID=50390 RepID=A0A6P7F6M5_DIAVI
MGDFEIIECSFNNADETINFGTRSMGPVTTCLFEICTLACFKSEDELFTGVSDLQINALIRNGQLFFATDKTLRIFQNMEIKNMIFNACFDSNISCITLSPDDRFLMVCFETGALFLFTIHDQDIEKVYSGSICENLAPQGIHSIDCSEDDEVNAHFLIVYPNGSIFRLIVKNNDTGFDVTTEEIINLKCKVNTSDYSYPLLSINGSSCYILNTETKDVITHDAFKVKNFSTLDNMLLSLDFDGNIFKLCPLTLITFHIEYDFLIDEMLVMNGSKSQILAVTKPNETGEIFLQLLESDFSQIFSLRINFPVYLIQMDFTKNDIVFASKVTSEDRIKELRLQSVYETEPESRLMRLVKRRRFVEAEQFAKTFNIDPSIILKAKAQLIVDKSKCSSGDIKDLLNLMDSINDAQFNLQCCTNVDCPNFDDVRQILTYGSKITPKPGDERKDDVLSMKETMLDLLFKFDTFMALSHGGDILAWTNFSMCNLLLEVKSYLKAYRVQDAIIVYSRLGATDLSSLNLQHVEDILEILNNLPADLYEPFLPTFIPITMTHLPSALYLFGNWLLNKIYQMEKRDTANFPANAIKMVDEIVKLIRVESKSYISFQRHCLSNKDFDHLATITEGLKTLQTLKKKFGITIHLNEYLEGPKVLTTALMKLSMASDQYDYFLKEFLYTFMLQNEIDPDTIFVEEINNLLQFSESWIVIIEVILKHISSVELKLRTVKDILEKAPVPWCEVTRRIAQSALQLTHPLVKDIELIYNDEPRLIVLRNAKYGIKKAQNANGFNAVIRRIIYVNEPHMIDDIYQFCSSEKEEIEASIILIQRLIYTGRLDESRDVIALRLKNGVASCLTRIIIFAESIINDKNIRLQHVKTNFYDMLPQLYQKLIGLTSGDIEKRQLEEDCRILRGVYYFNNEFGTEFVTEDFKSPSTKKKKYDELLQSVLDIIDPASISFSEFVSYSEKIAYHLSKDKDEVLVTLCEKFKKFDMMYKAGEHLLDNNATSSNMCIVASLFVKYLGSQNLPEFDASRLENDCDQTLPTFVNLKYEDDSCKNDIFVNSLKLAGQLITKAQLKADPCDLLKINEINDWINSCYYLTLQDSTLHDRLYKHLYCPKENLPSTTVLSTIRNCYEAYVLTINKKSYTTSDYLAYFGTYIETRKEPLVYEISNLTSAIDLFCREGQHLTAFSLLRTLSNTLYLQPAMDKTTIKPLRTLLHTRFLPQLMYAVVSAKFIDLDLLFTLLITARQDAMKYLMHYLQTNKRNSKKLHDLSLVGKSNYFIIFLSLVNWKPEYEIESQQGRKTIVMKNNEDALHKICQDIISVIGDSEKKSVLKSMEIMLKEVNFYHYEVFHTIYKILENNQLLTNSEYIVMLQFLKSYTRFQSPSQREKEEWYITFPDTQILDPLSEYRLPFTPILFTSDIWSILRPEISLRSYELWFPATKMLKHLKKDDICVYAVKQVVTSGILGKEQSKDWLLYSKFDDLFEEVDRCVQHISDLERATSVVYHLMNYIPDGADKVKAALLSFKYVTAYRNNHLSDGEVERAFIKVKNKYFGLSVCHILNRFNLAKESYLQLVTQPHSLIEALYMDSRIPKYAGTFCFEYSDINNAVDSLCELFNLDVQEIRKDLLHRWLNSSYLELDTETYSCFMPNMSSAPKINNDEDNLKRAIYICSSGNPKDWQSYLLGVGINEEDEDEEGKQNKFSFKTKALKCFCAIADEETIVTLTKLSYNEFLNYIDKLTLLSDLESLGIFLSVETLQQYNKKELLKKLSNIGKPLAIKCMGALCITYLLEENLYWDYIVKSSIKLEMIDELKIYVEYLKNKRDKKLYIHAWQAIIDKSFHKISNISDENLETVLVNNFLIIQSCPVSFSLNFDKIIHTCVDLGKPEFAALLLQYMSKDKQAELEIDIFKNPLKSSALEKLKKKGLWGVRSLKHVESTD